jgi:hypothetical protein
MRRLVVISCALAATAGIAFAQTSGGSNQPAQKQTTEQGGTSSQKTDKGPIRSASPAASIEHQFWPAIKPALMASVVRAARRHWQCPPSLFQEAKNKESRSA